jgi:hypothetical protein
MMAKSRAMQLTSLMAFMFVPHSARADEPTAADRETSRAAYAAGVAALDQHDFASAERSCRGAHALVPVPTSASCLGRALVGLGRLVEARDAFSEAAHFPIRPDEPPVFTTARTSAQAEAERLSTRIPAVLLVVTGPSESALLTVTVDGASIAAETARLPRKVNPGRHVISVASVGFEPVRIDVEVSEGEERRVPVALRPSGIDTTGANTEISTTPAPAPASSSTTRVGAPAWTAFGVGGAGLVVGGVAAVLAFSSARSAKNHCVATACTPAAQTSINSAKTWATVSDIGFAVAGIGAAVGVGLVVWGGSPRKTTTTTTAIVDVGIGSLELRGTW